MSTDVEETGPIDYLVVEFPGSRMTGEGLPLLVDLVEKGIIRILDLVFVTRGTDGSITAMEISDFDGDDGRTTLGTGDVEMAVDGVDPVGQPHQAAAGTDSGAADAIVVHGKAQSTVACVESHVGSPGVAVLGDVGQELGHTEVGDGLDGR